MQRYTLFRRVHTPSQYLPAHKKLKVRRRLAFLCEAKKYIFYGCSCSTLVTEPLLFPLFFTNLSRPFIIAGFLRAGRYRDRTYKSKGSTLASRVIILSTFQITSVTYVDRTSTHLMRRVGGTWCVSVTAISRGKVLQLRRSGCCRPLRGDTTRTGGRETNAQHGFWCYFVPQHALKNGTPHTAGGV